MSKILIVYYWGHVEKMAYAVAEGVRSVAGGEVAQGIMRLDEITGGTRQANVDMEVFIVERV